MMTVMIVLVVSACDEFEESTADNDKEVEAEEQTENDTNENEEASEDNQDDNEGNSEEDVEKIKIGEPAEVADVTFTVTSADEADVIESDNEFIDDAETSGKFVILDVDVENGKDESITIDGSYFTLVTGEDKEYDPSTDVDAMMALGDDASDFFLAQINPDLSKSGIIVFEVGDDVVVKESTLKAQTGFFGTETIEVSLTE